VAANDYHVITTWRIGATPAEVTSILGDAGGLAAWWPSVYLSVRVLEEGDDRGLGKVVDLWTKGFLPYTLRWRFTVTESNPPNGFRLEASGDFIGRGIWTLEPETGANTSDEPSTLVTYDWLVIAEKGILKTFSPVMKPIFSANHHWAMARGEESLKLELARRRAATDPVVLAAIRPAPGPTFPHNLGRGIRRQRSG
jgi:hypothetical protein